MKTAPRRDQFQPLDVRGQNPHVSLGQAGRRSPALLKLFLTGRRLGIHQKITHSKLFDKSQRFLARSCPDGEHANYRADTENYSQRGQQRSCLLPK